MSDDVRWDEPLADLAEAVESNLSTHPEPASLVGYDRGELPETEAEALAEHLAWCRECSDLLQGWQELAAGEAERATPQERTADWQAVRDRLAAGEASREEWRAAGPPTRRPDPAQDQGPRRVSPPEGARPMGLRLTAGLAAALMVVVGGAAAFWFLGPGERFRESQRPQPNVPFYDLVPPGTDRSAAEEEPTLAIEDGPVVILNTRQPLEERRYEALVRDREGRRVLAVSGLEPTEFGNLTLRLPAGSLTPGRYTIDLRAEGGESVLESYPVRVVE